MSEDVCACGYMFKFMNPREAKVFMWVWGVRISHRVGE